MEGTIKLRIDQVVVKPELQPRTGGIDPDYVLSLEESAGSWPPIVVVLWQASHILVDGFHRLCAAQNLGLEVIEVQVVDLTPGQPLWALAFELNAVHGRPLSVVDRRAFASRLLRENAATSNLEVARHAGLSPTTVAAIRERLEQGEEIEPTEQRLDRTGRGYRPSDHVSRQPGELPSTRFTESVGQIFSSAERKRHRRIADYYVRLATALADQADLEGFETTEDAVSACKYALTEEQVASLADDLGLWARVVLRVAVGLGFDPEAP
jgi:hypothetical protein